MTLKRVLAHRLDLMQERKFTNKIRMFEILSFVNIKVICEPFDKLTSILRSIVSYREFVLDGNNPIGTNSKAEISCPSGFQYTQNLLEYEPS